MIAALETGENLTAVLIMLIFCGFWGFLLWRN